MKQKLGIFSVLIMVLFCTTSPEAGGRIYQDNNFQFADTTDKKETYKGDHQKGKAKEEETGGAEKKTSKGMDHEMHTEEHSSGETTGSVLLTDPMVREGSGTSWHPEETPMFMSMHNLNKWVVMLHGDIKLRYNKQGGPRGDDQVSAPNWFMAMGQRKLNESTQIMLRTMISLDRITEGGSGYPLLFQTGETWNDEPLIDRQHPHDLISELAVSVSKAFTPNLSGYFYLGYPGEPALGPPAFMHRVSASPNPDAPIGHHWQDATHITFGVATLGVSFGNMKLEGSIFTGREPDENRFDFDRPRFDSYAGRISYNPVRQLALQFSSGIINNPEGSEEHEDKVYRTSASAIYSLLNGRDSFLSTAFVWAVNNEAHTEKAQHSFLIEPAFNFGSNTIYARLEVVQKPRNELGIDINPGINEDVGAYTLGFMRKILTFSCINLNAGIQGSLYSMTGFVKQYYGDPFSFQVYLGISPTLMIH